MPKSRQQKEEVLDQAKKDVAQAKSMVFAGYHGLSVPQLEQLRRQLRKEDVRFDVLKKTLLKKALEEKGIEVDIKSLGAGLAVAFGLRDEVAPAKVLANFRKENEALAIYGGILEGKFIDETRVTALSKLPSRQELYAKVVGSLNAPVSGFVNVLAGNIRGLVNVLNGIKEAKA